MPQHTAARCHPERSAGSAMEHCGEQCRFLTALRFVRHDTVGLPRTSCQFTCIVWEQSAHNYSASCARRRRRATSSLSSKAVAPQTLWSAMA